ncbi:small acid-soluble spore protein Tlp [Dehalobacterium formicoaceticum]|uniref:Protein Tlp homolog n=1 Tax=Dehalobacterium formicoaceticum TaxID=51515 RepID=A0ABT1Y084_9FIRM|nr:small acid-soluble spore protein Tlp [Dehalobacterium formicoaceticum]MCR6544277.1 small acid-soluble spore protein Tlp [Dehalobacterium formicoaceticum]
MKRNRDDRRDNVDRIQKNINHTIGNIEAAEELIQETDDPKIRKDLKEKNSRRMDALNGMKEEIKDEAWDKKQGYQD